MKSLTELNPKALRLAVPIVRFTCAVKFTTLHHEVSWAMMLKKTSSLFVGNATAGSIRRDGIHSARNMVTLDPTQNFVGALVWRKHWVKDVLYSPASDDHCQAF